MRIANVLSAALIATSVLSPLSSHSQTREPAGRAEAGAARPADNNGGDAMATKRAAPQSLEPNHGHFLCSAAINGNGTVASKIAGSYIEPSTTLKIPGMAGTYQVGFKAPCSDIRIQNGYFRIVQADTLTFGTMPHRACTVADRAGVASAIWVQCYDANGNLADTDFTISVSR